MSSAGIRSVARNTAFLTAARGIGITCRLAYVVLVARWLGPDLYAVLAYSQAWTMAFLPLAVFGLGAAIVWSIAPDRDRAAEIAAATLFLRLLTTLLAVALCVALSRVIAPDARALPLIAVLAIALTARGLAAWAQHIYAAFENNEYTLRQEALFRVVDLAVAVVVLLSGGTLLLLVAAHAAVWCLQAARSLQLVRRDFVPLAIDPRPHAWRPMIVVAIPFLAIALTVTWRMNGALILFRNLVDNAPQFAQFALAMQAFFIAALLPAALFTAAQPVLRRAAQRGDGKDLLYASAVQRVGLIAGAAVGLAGMELGEPIFGWVFGSEFARAGELAGLSLWCLTPMIVGNAYPPVLIARGEFRAQVIVSVLGAVLLTLLMFYLVPRFGAPGAIAAVFAGFALPPAIIYAMATLRGLTKPLTDLAAPLAAVIVALACQRWADDLGSLPALGLSLGALALATLLIGAVDKDELRRFSRPA